MGGMSQALCGQCLRLTNQRTQAQLVVRIVDMCGHGGEAPLLYALLLLPQLAVPRCLPCSLLLRHHGAPASVRPLLRCGARLMAA